MLAQDVHTLAKELIQLHGLDQQGWIVTFNKQRDTFGVCDYNRKRIELSALYFNREDGKIRNTILHEIAHAIAKGHDHNLVWKTVAQKIGCDGEICGQW